MIHRPSLTNIYDCTMEDPLPQKAGHIVLFWNCYGKWQWLLLAIHMTASRLAWEKVVKGMECRRNGNGSGLAEERTGKKAEERTGEWNGSQQQQHAPGTSPGSLSLSLFILRVNTWRYLLWEISKEDYWEAKAFPRVGIKSSISLRRLSYVGIGLLRVYE